MFLIEYATEQYKSYWNALDRHISDAELTLKMRDKRCYIIKENDKPVGVMRYNLFWDNIPFLTLIHFEESYRGKGYGTNAMIYWENEMQMLGYKAVMTSTQVNEDAQHFYRKLGYKDTGCLLLDIPSYEQPMEMFMIKSL